jgi:arylsulfatase A-like enzyme
VSLLRALVLAALVGVAACAGGPPDLERLGRPGRAAEFNLLLITVDTLRADRLGCYGHAQATTPVVDGLAARGIRFEQAVCTAPITLPSHASLLTGLDVPDHGVRHNGTFKLGPEHTTLAETLQSRGYATAAFVGAYVLDARYGLAQGFDHYDDAVDVGDAGGTDFRFIERPADRVADAALDWLDAHLDQAPGRPFFAWTHFFDPHGPYEPPGEYRERFAGSPYDGEVAFTDAQVGRIVDRLRERDVLDSTLIVFTSDHGEGLGDHDELTHGALIYESTMRVPLILSNPMLFPDGVVVSDRVAGSIDVLPTVLDLLGVPFDRDTVDGLNLTSVASADPGRALYVESLLPLLDFGWAPLHGLRRVGDKLIQAPTPEYYDLRADPGETVNRYVDAAEVPLLQSDLDARLERWPPALAMVDAEQVLDPEQIERLAALGYVRARAGGGRLGVHDPKEMTAVANRIQRAGQLSATGRHDEAIREIETVIAEDPTDGKAWYTAVQIFDRTGRFDRAEPALRKALELSPRADGYIILARYTLNRGDFQAYEQALAEAERLDPDDAGIIVARAHGHAKRGRFAEARTEFERALEADPVRWGAHVREQLRQLDRIGR